MSAEVLAIREEDLDLRDQENEDVTLPESMREDREHGPTEDRGQVPDDYELTGTTIGILARDKEGRADVFYEGASMRACMEGGAFDTFSHQLVEQGWARVDGPRDSEGRETFSISRYAADTGEVTTYFLRGKRPEREEDDRESFEAISDEGAVRQEESFPYAAQEQTREAQVLHAEYDGAWKSSGWWSVDLNDALREAHADGMARPEEVPATPIADNDQQTVDQPARAKNAASESSEETEHPPAIATIYGSDTKTFRTERSARHDGAEATPRARPEKTVLPLAPVRDFVESGTTANAGTPERSVPLPQTDEEEEPVFAEDRTRAYTASTESFSGQLDETGAGAAAPKRESALPEPVQKETRSPSQRDAWPELFRTVETRLPPVQRETIVREGAHLLEAEGEYPQPDLIERPRTERRTANVEHRAPREKDDVEETAFSVSARAEARVSPPAQRPDFDRELARSGSREKTTGREAHERPHPSAAEPPVRKGLALVLPETRAVPNAAATAAARPQPNRENSAPSRKGNGQGEEIFTMETVRVRDAVEEETVRALPRTDRRRALEAQPDALPVENTRPTESAGRRSAERMTTGRGAPQSLPSQGNPRVQTAKNAITVSADV